MAGPLARAAVLAGAVLAVLVGPAAAQALPERPAGYVSDGTGRLRPDTVARLDADLAAYEARSGNEIGVAVVATTGGTDIADYSRQVFNHWGVGQAGLDNGALLVVAVDDRRLRLEVGDGLRDQLSDAAAASIVEQEIVPRLRAGDLDGGVEAGVIGARRALGDDVTTPDVVEPAVAPAPYEVGAEPADEFFSSEDRSPGDAFGGWVVLALGVAAVGAVGARIFSSSPAAATGAGSDRCPECGDLLGRRPIAEPTGARYWISECRSCSYRSGFARGGTWGRGAGLFGALGTALLAGDRRRDDGPGLFGWGGGSHSGSGSSGGSGGSFGGGSFGGGSSGGGSIGGGGSSSGGGASGSW